MRWLFVMAHPDDEVDVGGTIYQLRQAGNEVAVAIMVGRVTARRNLSETLEKDTERSMGILGVSKVYRAGFPNIRTNIIAQLEMVRFVERCIRDWRAEAIVTHHSADVNIDHLETGKATIAACRLFQRVEETPKLRLMLFCEASGATEWSLNSSKNRFIPNYFVDIGKDGFEAKIQAHYSYSGVPRRYPHPYSTQCYEGLAYLRAAQTEVEYTEAFECVFRSY